MTLPSLVEDTGYGLCLAGLEEKKIYGYERITDIHDFTLTLRCDLLATFTATFQTSVGADGKPISRNEHDEFVKKWGFSYNDILDLDKAIVMFILPRMAYYREHCTGYPSDFAEVAKDGTTVLNEEEAVKNWKHILDTICEGLHCYLEKDFDESEEKHEKWNAAKKYLFDYFEAFWN